MSTFRAHEPGGTVARLGFADVLTAMDEAAVEGGVLAAKVHYPTTINRLQALHQELARLSSASAGTLRWIVTVMPPEHEPGSYWDLMRNLHLLQALGNDPDLGGVHIAPSPWAWRRATAGTIRCMPMRRIEPQAVRLCRHARLALANGSEQSGPSGGRRASASRSGDRRASHRRSLDRHRDPSRRSACELLYLHLCIVAEGVSAKLAGFHGRPLAWHSRKRQSSFRIQLPFAGYAKTAAAAQGLALPDADQRRVLYGNARALLFQ